METTNPYATPAADLADVPTEKALSGAPFFAVSPFKLAVMCLCTMGLYQIYWFYMNWRIMKEQEGENIYPALRSVFSIFFCHALCVRVREKHERLDLGDVAAGPLAAGWIILSLT